MKSAKRKRLAAKGWKVGSVRELLGLSDVEALFVETKARLAHRLYLLRKERALSQAEVARRIASSQSRVNKMEKSDASVSLDLLVRALLALGATPEAIGDVIAGR